MFSEPIALTLLGATVSMKRINQDGYSSEYFGRMADNSEVRMKIRHVTQKAKGITQAAERHSAELSVNKVTTNGTQRYQSYFVFLHPIGGDVTTSIGVATSILGFGSAASLGAMADWAS